MKINEKNVVSFAVCNSPIDREGYLLKKGETNKGYQRRWFILKGNLLFYFERRIDKEPIGVIILEGCTVELTEQQLDSFTFCIDFPGPNCRTYILAANSQEDMESWMKAITCASYDFMKLMVAELQKQLEEVNLHFTSTMKTRVSPQEDAGQASKNVPVKSARFNPFNSVQSRPADALTVGNAVFHTGRQESDDECDLVSEMRFEELHEIYGRKIRQKMLEHCLSSTALSDRVMAMAFP